MDLKWLQKNPMVLINPKYSVFEEQSREVGEATRALDQQSEAFGLRRGALRLHSLEA